MVLVKLRIFLLILIISGSQVLAQEFIRMDSSETVNPFLDSLVKYKRENPQLALKFIQQGIESAKKKGDIEGEIRLHINKLGLKIEIKPDSVDRLVQYISASINQHNLSHLYCELHALLGRYYLNRKELKKSFGYLQQAQETCREYDLQDLLHLVYLDISTYYLYAGTNDERAESLLKLVINYFKEHENPKLYITANNNLATTYLGAELYDQAKQTLSQAITVCKEYQDDYLLSITLGNLSVVYNRLGNYDSAIYLLKEAIDLSEKNHFIENVQYNSLRLVNLYDGKGERDSVIYAINKTLDILLKKGDGLYYASVYKWAADFFDEKQEMGLAYTYLKRYHQVLDSLNNDKMMRELEELEINYNLMLAENELKSNQRQVVRQTKIVWSLIGGLVLLIFLVGALFKLAQTNRRNNRLLKEANKQVRKSLSEKEVLLKEIHHRVKNNLQVVSSLLSLKNTHSSDLDEEILESLQNKIQTIAYIHDFLYKSKDFTLIQVDEYFQNLIKNIQLSFNLYERNIQISSKIDQMDLDMDYLIPCGLIVNELVTNCVKHAFPEHDSGAVYITMGKINNTYLLSVEDNGIGMKKDFEEYNFGLNLVYGLADQIHGKVTISNGIGTRVEVSFDIR